MAKKTNKLINTLTPPSSPVVKRSTYLWRDMMGILRRKDSTSASNIALSNVLNNNRVSCPALSVPPMTQQRYYNEVGLSVVYNTQKSLKEAEKKYLDKCQLSVSLMLR